MNIPVLHWICMVAISLGVIITRAQTGTGSTTVDNSTVTISPGTVELRFAEAAYFGPDADWEINGTLEIWSSKIWIAPTARFTGTGSIIIHDPGTNPFYEDMPRGPTQIDGNGGRLIGVAVELRNPQNLVLTDLADPGYGITNPVGNDAAALRLGNVFDFAVDSGDVVLNGNNLYLSTEGSLSGYNSNRMIVTGNSIENHVIKTYKDAQPFTFPVGIAEHDYTPATLSPAKVTTLHVGVQDYQASDIPVSNPQAGMDRMWHIYADEATYTAYTLQHHHLTNGSAYVDEQAQMVQYAGSGNWVGGITERISRGIHARNLIAAATATADDSWLTKLVSAHAGPQAMDDQATGPAGRPLIVLVLENDRVGSSAILVNSVQVRVQPQHGTVAVNADGSITYHPNRRFEGQDSFIYEITDENGLTDMATVLVDIIHAELIIPNAVTPNGDGKNDRFTIQGLDNYDNADLTIFNRWGNEVYRSRSYHQEWEGIGVSDGTYYYRLVLRKDGAETIHSGWVLVKRGYY